MSSTNFQPAYETLLRSHSEEKEAIARQAERLILDGDTVFLEGSTTVFELARQLTQRNRLTVVTNSPTIVCELQHSSGVSVLCTGGDLQKDTFYLAGEWAHHALSEIRLDKAVMGVSAIAKAAKTRIGLADNSKFGKQAFAYVGPVTDFDVLVTDSGTDAKYIEDLRDAKIEVLVAEVK
jgi:DeoR/GlpR family transcriptional regulator of sugar metabolism